MKTRVVLCGSFHRQPETIAKAFRELEATGCRILSPISLDFVDPHAGVVRTLNEAALNDHDIERFHIRALRDAQFVWLHAPEGYVGISAAYELGYASALTIPVFSRDQPTDPAIQPLVTVVGSVFEALELIEGFEG